MINMRFRMRIVPNSDLNTKQYIYKYIISFILKLDPHFTTASSVLPQLSHYLASPLVGLQDKIDEFKEGNALVRDFHRFKEVSPRTTIVQRSRVCLGQYKCVMINAQTKYRKKM